MLLVCHLGRERRNLSSLGWGGRSGERMHHSWEMVSARLPGSARARFLLEEPSLGRRGPLVSLFVESLGEYCLCIAAVTSLKM